MQATKLSLHEQFLKAVCQAQCGVTVFMMNGFQLRGVVSCYDADAVVVVSEGRQNMIFRHAISTITPAVPIKLEDN